MTQKKTDIATIMGNMEKYVPGDTGPAGIEVDDVNTLLTLYCWYSQSTFGETGAKFIAPDFCEWFMQIFKDVLADPRSNLHSIKPLFESGSRMSWYLKRQCLALGIEMADSKQQMRILWCAQRVPQETGEDSRLGFKEAQELVEDLISGETY